MVFLKEFCRVRRLWDEQISCIPFILRSQTRTKCCTVETNFRHCSKLHTVEKDTHAKVRGMQYESPWDDVY